jgi:DNA-binding HxlR family transcriptional regulator
MAQPETKLNFVGGRSRCPVNLATELLGDRWTPLLIRDLVIRGPLQFRELLTGSTEGIASNILASRLARLVEVGLLTRSGVEGHRQKVRYHLAEPAIDALPVLVALGVWGDRWLPADPTLGSFAKDLADGGVAAQRRYMDELRYRHLTPAPPP